MTSISTNFDGTKTYPGEICPFYYWYSLQFVFSSEVVAQKKVGLGYGPRGGRK